MQKPVLTVTTKIPAQPEELKSETDRERQVTLECLDSLRFGSPRAEIDLNSRQKPENRGCLVGQILSLRD